ncbi:cardiolipin synthase [Lysobacter sp. TY2-98]|uniref:cardiolipin synthase n=1 Tax=Lysobacter sp. TY2-98 TaxID=2290922 RepID=UPI000E205D44|nr:cardiolipin synthase [Lysobacter sp. TY2-98]AXK73195.1 cardiolipin synthase [Lysobacter sp. TY2-98]
MLKLVDTLHALVHAHPTISAWLLAGWLLYLVGLGLWIVMQKREPAATLAWLISLAALPYVGFLVYYVFGPQRIRRQRLRRGRARARMPDAPESASAESRELARLGLATTRLPASTATDVQLLVDGGATYEALLDAIAAAQHHVHLEYYIFEPDRTGTRVRDALIARAQSGVTVRLLVDAVGSARLKHRFLAPLLDAGGEVAWFHPMLSRWRRPWLNMRSHRKIVVVDGTVAFTGGINVTDEEDDRLRSDAYRDLHLRLEGEVVGYLQQVFVEDWIYATGQRPPSLPRVVAEPGPVSTQVLVSGPDAPWEAIHRMHVSAIHAARERVWLATPYFVPGEAAMMALTSAALAGLDVRLLVPRRSDSRLVTFAARSYFDELLAAGARIHEYAPRMLHTKALLCDDEIAIIGSANFDHRSFRLNFEVSMLFRDAGIAAALADILQRDMCDAPRVRVDRHRSFLRARLPEALARLMSPLL